MRNQPDPSLNHSIGYNYKTIIRSHYLKNIRQELLEEEEIDHHQCNNEIAYVTAEINGVATTLMIDMGANVSLIDSTEINRIQEESKSVIPTLPINNIILVGATGRQNKTVKKQVNLEVTSRGVKIPMIFLVANGLPFCSLIGLSLIHICVSALFYI